MHVHAYVFIRVHTNVDADIDANFHAHAQNACAYASLHTHVFPHMPIHMSHAACPWTCRCLSPLRTLLSAEPAHCGTTTIVTGRVVVSITQDVSD